MTEGRGDEDELLELLPRLRRFCFSLTGTWHDADDLMQATVKRLLEKPPPQEVILAKWMFRVCKNIWIDEVRSRKVRAATPIDDAPEAAATDGERGVMDRIMFEQVNQSMAALPDDQRVVVSLVAVEGYSYKEAAEMLGIPIGTVMSRLSRARGTLADLLADAQTA